MKKFKQKIKDFYLIHIKRRLTSDEAVRLIIDNQLKKYNVDMTYIINDPEIDGVPWYNYYTFDSKKEYQKWEKFAKRMIKKSRSYSDEKVINREFSYLNLMWGLKTNYDIYT